VSKTTDQVRDLSARFPQYSIWQPADNGPTWYATLRGAKGYNDDTDSTVYGATLDELAGKLQKQKDDARQSAERLWALWP
jgi:hypothetical protein